MTAAFRRLDPAEPDSELLLLSASVGSAACAGAWLFARLPLPQCTFRALTGCPCPTCGATRCLLALIHGHITQAIAWNPLVFIGLLFLILLNLYALAALTARLPRLRLSFNQIEGRILRNASILLLASNWAYEIHHGV